MNQDFLPCHAELAHGSLQFSGLSGFNCFFCVFKVSCFQAGSLSIKNRQTSQKTWICDSLVNVHISKTCSGSRWLVLFFGDHDFSMLELELHKFGPLSTILSHIQMNPCEPGTLAKKTTWAPFLLRSVFAHVDNVITKKCSKEKHGCSCQGCKQQTTPEPSGTSKTFRNLPELASRTYTSTHRNSHTGAYLG